MFNSPYGPTSDCSGNLRSKIDAGAFWSSILKALKELQLSCTLVCVITATYCYSNHYSYLLYVAKNNLVVIKDRMGES